MARKQRISTLLTNKLEPSLLTIKDESPNHHVPEGAETHFKLVIVCDKFDKLTLLARHRLINGLLAAEFNNGLHALSLHVHTAQEWQALNKTTPDSPACRDGYRHR